MIFFFKLGRQKSESIVAYVTDLKSKTKNLSLSSSQIRDRIVGGVANDQVRARLLKEPDLTLCKVFDICRAYDATQSHMKNLHEVNKLRKAKQIKKPNDKCDSNKCCYKYEPRK